MPLAILAAANAAVSAIQQGCELYKEYKGVVLKAKATFDEVKGNVEEVVGIWSFIKGKLFPSADKTHRKVTESVTKRAPDVPDKTVQVEQSELTITSDLIANLKIFFNCLAALEEKVHQAELAALDVTKNTLESALDIEYAMVEVQKLQVKIRETMVYNSPPELGDLYTRVVARVGVIKEQQELARLSSIKKQRLLKWKQEQRLYKIQSRIWYVATALIIALEIWGLLLTVSMVS